MASSNSDLARKLGLKAGLEGYVLHAPSGYAESLPIAIFLSNTRELIGKSVWIQAFYFNKDRLEEEISSLKKSLAKNGQLWLCWPKKSSGITSDLSDSLVRQIGLNLGLVDIKVAAINDTWSGLKFVYRLTNRPQ